MGFYLSARLTASFLPSPPCSITASLEEGLAAPMVIQMCGDHP